MLVIIQEEYKQSHPNYSLFLNVLGLLGHMGNHAFFVIKWDSLGPKRCCAHLNATKICIYHSLKNLRDGSSGCFLYYRLSYLTFILYICLYSDMD